MIRPAQELARCRLLPPADAGSRGVEAPRRRAAVLDRGQHGRPTGGVLASEAGAGVRRLTTDPAGQAKATYPAGRDTADPQASPMPNELIGAREHNWLTSKSALDCCTGPFDRVCVPANRSTRPDRPRLRWSARVWWAREELNLRPLPCQIQRAIAALYGGRSKIVEDGWKAPGEARCQRLSPQMIRHDSPTIVLIPTAVVCCPSAAPTRHDRPSGPQSDSPARVIQPRELKAGDLRFLRTVNDACDR
jgi:hypothetical protein